jgi:hypothetical protein
METGETEMEIRSVHKANGEVAVRENGKDKTYYLRGSHFSVYYSTGRKNKSGRRVMMTRTLDPNGAKASAIRKILEDAA